MLAKEEQSDSRKDYFLPVSVRDFLFFAELQADANGCSFVFMNTSLNMCLFFCFFAQYIFMKNKNNKITKKVVRRHSTGQQPN